MTSTTFTIEDQGAGSFAVQATSFDEPTNFVLILGEPARAAGLGSDEATARSTVDFLLSHQDAGDLPKRVEIDTVIAAYPDAVDTIQAIHQGRHAG